MPKYILCDIEATGNQKNDRIIQLGLMILEDTINSKPLKIYNELNFVDVDITPPTKHLKIIKQQHRQSFHA